MCLAWYSSGPACNIDFFYFSIKLNFDLSLFIYFTLLVFFSCVSSSIKWNFTYRGTDRETLSSKQFSVLMCGSMYHHVRSYMVVYGHLWSCMTKSSTPKRLKAFLFVLSWPLFLCPTNVAFVRGDNCNFLLVDIW